MPNVTWAASDTSVLLQMLDVGTSLVGPDGSGSGPLYRAFIHAFNMLGPFIYAAYL